jgi:hypothetical protein
LPNPPRTDHTPQERENPRFLAQVTEPQDLVNAS